MWVTQRLREFLELYPDIRIELVLNDEQIAIAMRAADVAIWTSEPQQSDLIRRPLFTHEDARLRLLAVHPPPRRAADARRISTITPSSPTAARRRAHLRAIRWLETAGLNGKEPRKPAFSANSVIAMKYAIRAGIGIGLIPDYLTGEETDLVPVLQDVELPTMLRLFRLSRGAEDGQEGAGLPRFSGSQGAAVEVLEKFRRGTSHAAAHGKHAGCPIFNRSPSWIICPRL